MNRNKIIHLERKSGTEWETVATLHAKVNKVKGAESLDGAAIQAPKILNFDVRYSSIVAAVRLNTQDYRIRYGTDGAGHPAYFKVTEDDDYFERHRNVRLIGVSYRG